MADPLRVSPHTYIAGMTDQGKSTFARRLILEHLKPAGFPVIALDPKCDPRFQADFITRDSRAFMAKVHEMAGTKCAILVDESGKTIGQFAGEMEELATMNRELGHRCIFIGQRSAQTSKTIILNCGNLVIFRSSGRDAKSLAADYGRPEILESVLFRQGEYLFLPGASGKIIKGNVFAGLPKK